MRDQASSIEMLSGAAVTARSASRPSRRRVIREPRNRGSTLAELPADVVMASPPSGIARHCDCQGFAF